MAEVTRVYVKISKQYGFNPPILKEVVFLRSKGFSNLEIAEQAGISRNTVSHYLEKLRGMEDEQMAELMSLVGMMMERHNRIFDLMMGGESRGDSGKGETNLHVQGSSGKRRTFYKQV